MSLRRLRFGSKSTLNVDYKCTIRLLDDNEILQYEFQRDTLGQDLLDHICNHLNLVEKDYFGLRYIDNHKQRHWLEPIKTILKQMKGHEPYIFCFRVKFYPPDPSRLQEEITRYQLFLQLRRDLLHGRLYCAQTDAAWLAAYIIQSEVGDYDQDIHNEGYVSEYKMLLKQTPRIEEKIAEIHKNHLSSQVPATAELNFLKKAAQQDTYGADPHPVKDQKGNHLYIGITHQGIMTFQGNKKTHHFKWPDVHKLHYEGKMFIIHLTYNEKKHACGFKCPTQPACKHLWKCAVEQKTFFTCPSSKDIPNFSSGTSGLLTLTRGSKFRYSGRVEKEIISDELKVNRDPPEFARVPIKQQPKRKKKGAFISALNKEITHDAVNHNAPTTPDSPNAPLQTDTILEEPPEEAVTDVTIAKDTSTWKYQPHQSLDLSESEIQHNVSYDTQESVFDASAVNHLETTPPDTSTPLKKDLPERSSKPVEQAKMTAKSGSALKKLLLTVFFMLLLTAVAIVLIMELDALRDVRKIPQFQMIRKDYYIPTKRSLGIK